MTDPTRYVLAVLSMLGLISAAVWVMLPFLPGMIWAGMIVIATWPALIWLQSRLGGRRWLAASILLTSQLLLLVLPIWLAVATLVEHGDQIALWGNALAQSELPPAPQWVAELPLVGEAITNIWLRINTDGFDAYLPQMSTAMSGAGKWLLAQAGGIGMLLVHLSLTVIIAAIFYMRGELVARGAQAFARRLAGEQGEALSRLGAQAVRGVAIGLVVTAIVQSMAGGLGLWIAGVPLVSLLIAAMFILTLAQVGPVVILVPATIWLFAEGHTGWAIFLGVWTMIVGTLDNFLRPWLIQRGADLSFLLVFAGVTGGLLAFGLIGLFIGPVVLAVAWTLLKAWVAAPLVGEEPEALLQSGDDGQSP